MPIEIQVGPPFIHISQGRTFMVTDLSGEIVSRTDQGAYANDTRFISAYRIYINRQPLRVVNSSQLSFYAARYNLTNPTIPLQGGEIEENSLRISITRMV